MGNVGDGTEEVIAVGEIFGVEDRFEEVGLLSEFGDFRLPFFFGDGLRCPA